MYSLITDYCCLAQRIKYEYVGICRRGYSFVDFWCTIPWPFIFTNLIYGSRQGAHAGIKNAYGHTIVELPLIIILALDLSKFSFLDLTSNEISR